MLTIGSKETKDSNEIVIEERFNKFISKNSPRTFNRKIDLWVLEQPLWKWIITIREKIENILGSNQLVKLLLLSKEYWLIDISSNLINEFTQEREVKIIDVQKEVIEDTLRILWAEKVFEWDIEDNYYDFDNDHIESIDWKVSFRIREKIDSNWYSSFYYTIKRKEPKATDSDLLRVCYEEEFKIKRISLFLELLKYFWFYKSRWKFKNRVSYQLGDIKFDIDDYDWIPTILEIESSTKELAIKYIHELWLENHKTSNWWSRSLFDMHWVEYKTFKSPQEKKEEKKIKKQQTEAWNVS